MLCINELDIGDKSHLLTLSNTQWLIYAKNLRNFTEFWQNIMNWINKNKYNTPNSLIVHKKINILMALVFLSRI